MSKNFKACQRMSKIVKERQRMLPKGAAEVFWKYTGLNVKKMSKSVKEYQGT